MFVLVSKMETEESPRDPLTKINFSSMMDKPTKVLALRSRSQIRGLANRTQKGLQLLFNGFLSCLERDNDWARLMHFEFVCN